ncbi:MAG: Gfo/Idh/MocA family oxidoreductase [Calditrichia bacterium]
MFTVGVIGVGYWGPNLIRNFIMNPKTRMKSCCDLKTNRLHYIRSIYPSLETFTDYRPIIQDPQVDLITICTPVDTHYHLARLALEAGKHVLIEKPMTATSQEAEELINIAEKKNLKIFVDHTFLFTGAVQKIKELLQRGEIGDLYYFDSVRVNLGLFQHDVNVIWDLAPHDISIMYYLLNQNPESVLASGASHFNSLEDVAYLTIFYPKNLIAHIHVNWLSPVKIRHTLLAGDKKMVVWDDNNPTEKVRIYDKGIEVVQNKDDIYDILIQYRTGDMYCPKLNTTEGLAVEVEHITDCLLNNKPSISDGHLGRMVVRILEAAQESIKNRGREVKI